MPQQDTAPKPIRLNKYIASRLSIGRRQVDELIEKGKVLVNSKRPKLGARVTDADAILIDGKPLPAAKQHVYLALNKPAGYICSRAEQGGTPTIYKLLPKQYHHLKPVGRLDKDSSGLLLLTDDGDFAHRLTHPSFSKQKSYDVRLKQRLQPLHHQMISDRGIMLPDGISKFLLKRITDNDDFSWRITMHEGRNRQIRRTFAALGYRVTKLHRIAVGPYHLENLASGHYCEIKI